ncbi:ELMO domain-containing protein 3 [Xenopus tropicalis]|uniref:ELMO domain-containing protein 3 n=1 Tax=Xenopus tropicalis TaxID=8364 RepID=A0A8J0PM08_XENTR|nr:ELMO domain-containing protein 3 [Xenopus tropicalis]|eukprot:NP_001072642.2 ELMO domain-containing protein 3 [Xenopus tropicalis]
MESETMNGRMKNSDIAETQSSFLPAMKALPISAVKQNTVLQTLVGGAGEPEKECDREDMLRAQEEWEALETLQTGLHSEKSGLLGDFPGQTSLISFNEALQYFQTADMSEYKKKIQPAVRRSGLSLISHLLFGPPRLSKELHAERDLVLAIAQCPLDSSQQVHIRVLQTIYKRLTGARFDCPLYGSHWEQLGFQGLDPSTDLRAAGLLGLMHPLYMAMEPKTLPLAHDIFRLSQHHTQNFPFCIMSINITRICLQALREERVSKECNRRQQVFAVLNDFYVATFYHLYHIWKTQNKTISDSGFVLKEVESFAKRNPKELLRQLDNYLQERPLPKDLSPEIWDQQPIESSNQNRSNGNICFTGVCEQQVQEDRLI